MQNYPLLAAADRIALRIPIETEKSLGIQALTYMDEQGWFKQTNLEFDKREKIKDGFDRFCSHLPLNKYASTNLDKFWFILSSKYIAFVKYVGMFYMPPDYVDMSPLLTC